MCSGTPLFILLIISLLLCSSGRFLCTYWWSLKLHKMWRFPWRVKRQLLISFLVHAVTLFFTMWKRKRTVRSVTCSEVLPFGAILPHLRLIFASFVGRWVTKYPDRIFIFIYFYLCFILLCVQKLVAWGTKCVEDKGDHVEKAATLHTEIVLYCFRKNILRMYSDFPTYTLRLDYCNT